MPRITAAMCARGRALGEPKLSPDGSRVAFVASSEKRGSLVVVPVTGGPELVVTADPAVVPASSYGGGAFDWTPDGRSFVYAAVDGTLRLIPAEGGPTRTIVGGGARNPAVSPDGRKVAYVVEQERDEVGVVPLDADGGWPVRLSGGADFCFDPTWSPDSAYVAWQEWDVPNMPWDEGRIVSARADGFGQRITVAGGVDVSVQQPRFSPDGRALAYLSDANGWLNIWVAAEGSDGSKPVVEEAAEHGDPSWGPGQRSFAWSPDGRSIAFCRNEGGFGRLCVVHVAGGSVRDLSKGVHSGLSWVGDRIVCVRSGARTPTSVVAIDPATGDRTVLAHGPVAGFEAAGMVEPEVVHWQGDGGGDVHGRLYRPLSAPEGLRAPPMLVWIHGGPTGQQTVQFNARVAFFVDRGWAVLVPDHRGSTGWGRAYTQAMAGRWGELDVSDTAAGMRAAAERGWCDPRRMVPIGGSAGGFTVLNLLAGHPELCAAGVDLYGVADLFDLDETTHRFEAHYLRSVVGPLPEAADRYRDRSPVNLADRIQAPLLVLQGSDDKVVPLAQSKSIVDRLRALGRDVELQVYEGEGHGWQRAATVEDELTRTEQFLARHVLRRRA